ncbi:hypothetical protein Tco_1291493 [Tanacetum coccineum]
MTSGQISSGLDLTYAPSSISTQNPTERELDLLFEAMYDDYIGGQPSATPRTTSVAQAPQVLQTLTASTTIANIAPTLANSSSQATNIPNTSQDVDNKKIKLHSNPKYLLIMFPITMEPSNVKEAMKYPAWIDSMQEELLQFKQLDV